MGLSLHHPFWILIYCKNLSLQLTSDETEGTLILGSSVSVATFPNGNTFLNILLRSILKFPQFTFAIVCNTYYLGYPSKYFWEGWKKTPSLIFPFRGHRN